MMVVVFVVAIVPHEVYGQSGDSRCCSGGRDFPIECIGCHCGWSSNAHLGQGWISMKFDTLMLYSECSDL